MNNETTGPDTGGTGPIDGGGSKATGDKQKDKTQYMDALWTTAGIDKPIPPVNTMLFDIS